MTRELRLALPDLVSNSYFPAIAAAELGVFRKHGVDVALQMIYPAPACYTALAAGEVELVAGSAHLPLGAFPRWQGAQLLCALSQGMYWFLVTRRGLGIDSADLKTLRGMTIVAAAGVDLGFRRLLAAAGIDPATDNVTIGPLPGGVPAGVSFGVAAARAMVAGRIDGFWANGMAAAVAVAHDAGEVVLDVRRGDGPAGAFGYTQPTLAARSGWIASEPEAAAALVRAVAETQDMLRADPDLATRVAEQVFPAEEAGLIRGLVERDLPYYTPWLEPDSIDSMQAFALHIGLADTRVPYEQVVASVCPRRPA